ncbi:hypothetical protein B0F90DRAFT_1765773 [Multifurca ochricompacta]|uniref:Uncharacterized protein n=1 Tax=Multifurca ochricompacta TaxID=376703 RepID=A0AAD4QJX5_9AGAM|nr:hypothetical protein B0F90DRAFT_1765773 [Multifurca ochricompacta]
MYSSALALWITDGHWGRRWATLLTATSGARKSESMEMTPRPGIDSEAGMLEQVMNSALRTMGTMRRYPKSP